ncbi:Rieske (2Fe-2S) protein [Haloarchaeobius litoreus]|uniref:Rieske (2Fe-2S) protein n=1 Tax=Haloarchaeobius litoreus TaxID=755306 RepID=A0ABD6DIQ6_9EURY|nr:Rieske 2Fe-2S domain-containing protein [Haloarchaeobius litoreus]
MDETRRIAPVEDVPSESTLLFTVRELDADEEREAILHRRDDGVVAWLNYCQHLTHIKIDKGSGAPMRDDELVCANHGAMFESESGLCTYGPCEGAYLNALDVTVADGAVYLDEEDHELVGLGGVDADGSADLTSTSNVEF